MAWWHALLLGLLQGLTEFLPVSSSGHLVLAQQAFGLDATADVTFEVLLHLGTALSIITIYWRRLGSIIVALVRSVRNPLAAFRTDRHVRTGYLVLVASVPAGAAYAGLSTGLKAAFASPHAASAMLLVTAAMLALTRLAPPGGRRFGVPSAVLVGAAQALSLLPGLSRSGATICTGLYLRITPEEAADFSFIMVLPAVLGATLIEGMGLVGTTAPSEWGVMALGVVVAYATGIAAIRVVLAAVRGGQLYYFSFYCAAVGLLGLWLV